MGAIVSCFLGRWGSRVRRYTALITMVTVAYLLCLLAIPVRVSAQVRAEQPNIIVVLTDDQGYADIGAYAVNGDVRTPHIDQLAREGVLMTSGYVTAPQCVPSRAGLITGRYQQSFGVDGNDTGPLPLNQQTVADHLQRAGYVTGAVGKWHLSPTHEQHEWIAANVPLPWTFNEFGQVLIPASYLAPYHPVNRGFTEYFLGEKYRFDANFDLDGNSLPIGSIVLDDRTKVEVQSDAAIAFVDRNHRNPFFLYLAYSAPHVPFESPDSYLDIFPDIDSVRRRYALATIAQIDDGVGRIVSKLKDYAIDRKTLIVFLSDNGAPYRIDKKDLPISDTSGGWNGSLNDPWIGEKGMLTEGGIRIPFLMWYPDRIPQGTQYDHPVISLDIAATAYALAGLSIPDVDGHDLLPVVEAAAPEPAHEFLFWRWDGQLAIRSGQTKYLALEDGTDFLFDLGSPSHEALNLVKSDPKLADTLWRKAWGWAQGLSRPDFPTRLNVFWRSYLDYYLGDVLAEESRAAAITQITDTVRTANGAIATKRSETEGEHYDQ